jgi:hypothetical protein
LQEVAEDFGSARRADFKLRCTIADNWDVTLAHWSHPRSAVTVLGGLLVGAAALFVASAAESPAVGVGPLKHVPAAIALLLAGVGFLGAPLVVAIRGRRRVWLAAPLLLLLLVVAAVGIRGIDHHAQSVAQAQSAATAATVTRILVSQGITALPINSGVSPSVREQLWDAAWATVFQKAGSGLARSGVQVVQLHPFLVGISADLRVKGAPYCYHALSTGTLPDSGSGWATPGSCANPDYSSGG